MLIPCYPGYVMYLYHPGINQPIQTLSRQNHSHKNTPKKHILAYMNTYSYPYKKSNRMSLCLCVCLSVCTKESCYHMTDMVLLYKVTSQRSWKEVTTTLQRIKAHRKKTSSPSCKKNQALISQLL